MSLWLVIERTMLCVACWTSQEPLVVGVAGIESWAMPSACLVASQYWYTPAVGVGVRVGVRVRVKVRVKVKARVRVSCGSKASGRPGVRDHQ